jgi:hypothetical protein
MMFRETITVQSETQTNHGNIFCGLNVEQMKVKKGGTHSYHYPLKFLKYSQLRYSTIFSTAYPLSLCDGIINSTIYVSKRENIT